jgi:hypothetical protein
MCDCEICLLVHRGRFRVPDLLVLIYLLVAVEFVSDRICRR